MRSKACFSRSVCCDDGFAELPKDSQLLYYRLGFEADSDGAIDGMKGIVRSIGATDADLSALFDGGYLIDVEGVPFVRHWWVNNKRDSKNYRPGAHCDKLKKLVIEGCMPYELREQQTEDHQSDVSLTSDSNRKESSVTQTNGNEPKRMEGNGTEGDREECGATSGVLQCSECCNWYPAVSEGGSLHAYCDKCRSDIWQ